MPRSTDSNTLATLRQRMRDDSPLMTLVIQGQVVMFTRHRRGQAPPQGETRAEPSFSKQSRFRMMALMNRLDWQAIPSVLFVTLTYPDDTLEHGLEIERHRAEWIRRVLRGHAPFPVVWRVEWKLRKSGGRKGQAMPHLHLLILGLAFKPIEEIVVMWRGVIGATVDPNCYVKACTSHKMVMYYVSKYCAKEADRSCLLGNHTHSRIGGRHWGVVNRRHLPFCSMNAMTFSDERIAERVECSVIEQYDALSRYAANGFTVFIPNPGRVLMDATALDAEIRQEYNALNPDGAEAGHHEGNPGLPPLATGPC